MSSPVRHLLNYLRKKNIHVTSEGGHLIVEAPRGTVTPRIHTTLARHKQKIVSMYASDLTKLTKAQVTWTAAVNDVARDWTFINGRYGDAPWFDDCDSAEEVRTAIRNRDEKAVLAAVENWWNDWHDQIDDFLRSKDLIHFNRRIRAQRASARKLTGWIDNPVTPPKAREAYERELQARAAWPFETVWPLKRRPPDPKEDLSSGKPASQIIVPFEPIKKEDEREKCSACGELTDVRHYSAEHGYVCIQCLFRKDRDGEHDDGFSKRLRDAFIKHHDSPTQETKAELDKILGDLGEKTEPVYFGRLPWESAGEWAVREANEYQRARNAWEARLAGDTNKPTRAKVRCPT